jgi:hypothetical protein
MVLIRSNPCGNGSASRFVTFRFRFDSFVTFGISCATRGTIGSNPNPLAVGRRETLDICGIYDNMCVQHYTGLTGEAVIGYNRSVLYKLKLIYRFLPGSGLAKN